MPVSSELNVLKRGFDFPKRQSVRPKITKTSSSFFTNFNMIFQDCFIKKGQGKTSPFNSLTILLLNTIYWIWDVGCMMYDFGFQISDVGFQKFDKIKRVINLLSNIIHPKSYIPNPKMINNSDFVSILHQFC